MTERQMTQAEAADTYRQMQNERIEAMKDRDYGKASRLSRESWELANRYGLTSI
jgi:hypothetical protein